MTSVTKEEIKLVQKLILQGKSLNYIATTLGRKKGTIYYYFRKFKGKTNHRIIVNKEDSEKIGEFIGFFAGDGSFYKTPGYNHSIRLHLNIKDKVYLDSLTTNVLFPLFGKKPKIYQQENRLIARYYSKEIYLFIKEYLDWSDNRPKTYTVHLKNRKQKINFMKGFLCGSIDSDGHISEKAISFASVSSRLIHDISDFLTKLEFDHKVIKYIEKRPNRQDLYQINIRKAQRNKFHALIKPRNLRGMKSAPAGI